VAKLDRLSRSLLDFAGLTERARRKGWALVALDLGVDPSTPSGEMMASVLASFAQYERRLIGQRTRDALAIVQQNGSKSGRPIGTPTFRTIPAPIVSLIRELRGEGTSYRAIATELNERGIPTMQGGKAWAAQTVLNVCKREAA
jgi:DNA invertase Pin-like site-specific DNA recombinase